MTYSFNSYREVNSMSVFQRRPRKDELKEAEIQAIRRDTFKKIDKSNKSTKKLINLIEKSGITENIFEATGGKRRSS